MNLKRTVIITTNRGKMTLETYPETEITTQNFLSIANQGLYNGTKFHRVIPNFMVQTGIVNPPQDRIIDETQLGRQYHEEGVLSMAHAGPGTATSQFFICHNRQSTSHLDGLHTCFGKLTSGYDVLKQIQQGDTIESIKLT